MGLLNRIARRVGEFYAHATTLPQRAAYKVGYASEMVKSVPEITTSYANKLARNAGNQLGDSAIESASRRVQQPDVKEIIGETGYNAGQNVVQGAVDRIQQPGVRKNLRETVTYATKPIINSLITSLGLLFLLLFGGYLLYNFYNRK